MTGALISTSAALLVFVFGAAVLQYGGRGERPSALLAASLLIWLAIIGAGVVGEAAVRAVIG